MEKILQEYLSNLFTFTNYLTGLFLNLYAFIYNLTVDFFPCHPKSFVTIPAQRTFFAYKNNSASVRFYALFKDKKEHFLRYITSICMLHRYILFTNQHPYLPDNVTIRVCWDSGYRLPPMATYRRYT